MEAQKSEASNTTSPVQVTPTITSRSSTLATPPPSPSSPFSSPPPPSPQLTRTQLSTSLNLVMNAVNATNAAAVAAAAEAVAAAMPLDIKPKVEFAAQQQQTQKIKKLVRRNASDKLKLIQMVHDNPILWDSRLPNFKGAEEEKNRAWEHIGREFNAPGRRVARAFKSLRESYRRELAHVKLMGSGFKPKWSLYEAMDFLRDVIRERKGGSHSAESSGIGLNLSAYPQNIGNNNNNNNNHKSFLKLNSFHIASPYHEAALNLSKCSSNLTPDDYYYFVKSELEMSANSMGATGAGTGTTNNNSAQFLQQPKQQPLPAHQAQQQHQQQQQNDTRVSSTRNDSTQNVTYDDLDVSSVRSADEASIRNEASISHEGSDEVEELDAIDADFPYPLILDSSLRGNGVGAAGSNVSGPVSADGLSLLKRKRKQQQQQHMNDADMDDEEADDIDTYEGQMLQQHRHLRQQQNLGSMGGLGMDIPPPQTVREVLNSKFCGFISAKLNSMEDTEADNLMNKILMLLVQTQGNEGK